MPKQVIVIMEDHYPFGECEESTSEMTRVLVRKIYEVSVQEKNKLLEKASILKKLKYDQLIKLESVLEEEETIHFLFEYVPIRLETWISNINDQFIENFRDQLIKFSSYLANNFIKIEFKLKNIGMDHNYGAKYFLEPSFVYDPSINKEKLKSQYIRDISNLFKPYIESSKHEDDEEKLAKDNNVQLMKASEQQQNLENNKSATVANSKNKNNSISPATYDFEEEPQQNVKDSVTNNKTKEKLEKYYQHMNASMDVENEKILKEFMDVLDDEEEEEVNVQPVKNATVNQQQQSRNIPAQYQYNGHENEHKKTHSKQELPLKNQANVFQASPRSEEHFNNEKNHNKIMEPPKIAKNHHHHEQQQTNSSNNNPHQTDEEQVVWKDGDDLQDRIKKAILNSKSIINRFKTIKQAR